MLKHISPLRYPGGKAKLFRFLSYVINNNFPIENYVEPFAGGAGAALSLLINQKVNRIILNDSDENIYKFWYSVINKNRKFQNRVLDCEVNINEYQKYKEIYQKKRCHKSEPDFRIGFATFYLNRCNRSGILNSGPIGGNNQDGKWKIDARFNKSDLIQRLEYIYDYRHSIDIYNYDAVDFLKIKLPKLGLDPDKTLVYLDPPYYNHGCELYRKYYKKKDHLELKEYLKYDLKIKWVLSYDDNEEIRNLYQDIRKNGIVVNHFAHKAKIGRELIIISDNCLLPEDYDK